MQTKIHKMPSGVSWFPPETHDCRDKSSSSFPFMGGTKEREIYTHAQSLPWLLNKGCHGSLQDEMKGNIYRRIWFLFPASVFGGNGVVVREEGKARRN